MDDLTEQRGAHRRRGRARRHLRPQLPETLLTDHAMLTRTRVPPVAKGGVAADVITSQLRSRLKPFVSLASVHDRYPVAYTPE